MSIFPDLPTHEHAKYLPIICVSASRQVHDGVERRLNGFSYVQGSGDDHELWGMQGLTPALFWKHREELLGTSRGELPHAVEGFVQQSKVGQHGTEWRAQPTPVTATSGQLLIGSVPDMPSEVPCTLPGADSPVSFVIVSAHTPLPQSCSDNDIELAEPQKDPQPQKDPHILRLKLAEGKKDQLAFLQTVLPAATRFIKARLARGNAVCICCDTGKDASIGIALAALQLFFDDGGALLEPGAAGCTASKDSIRTRLQWIIASKPAANPSRATLKRVNEFLLSPPSFRRR
uniref:Acyl-homoserine-lactone synthase ) n=1 Tax=Ganoderma boninense TaxID=34458 RepID=A0A5K1JUJ6_9APHY|nr:Acyl-homoserine-lactone synthase (EC (Autoinducer synthesis protein) [Ganoderma boninense]